MAERSEQQSRRSGSYAGDVCERRVAWDARLQVPLRQGSRGRDAAADPQRIITLAGQQTWSS